jgi:hypothetical protein
MHFPGRGTRRTRVGVRRWSISPISPQLSAPPKAERPRTPEARSERRPPAPTGRALRPRALPTRPNVPEGAGRALEGEVRRGASGASPSPARRSKPPSCRLPSMADSTHERRPGLRHPLMGARLSTLLSAFARFGPPEPRAWPLAAAMVGSAVARAPFSWVEAALHRRLRRSRPAPRAPVSSSAIGARGPRISTTCSGVLGSSATSPPSLPGSPTKSSPSRRGCGRGSSAPCPRIATSTGSR